MTTKKEIKKKIRNTRSICGYLLNKYLETNKIKELNDDDRVFFKDYLKYIAQQYDGKVNLSFIFKEPFMHSYGNEFSFLSHFIFEELDDKTIDPPGTLLGQGVERLLKDIRIEKTFLFGCLEFQRGYLHKTPIIRQLPEDILKIIYGYVFGGQNPEKYVNKVMNFFKTPTPAATNEAKVDVKEKSKYKHKRCAIM